MKATGDSATRSHGGQAALVVLLVGASASAALAAPKYSYNGQNQLSRSIQRAPWARREAQAARGDHSSAMQLKPCCQRPPALPQKASRSCSGRRRIGAKPSDVET
jgi:hypothetical protein